jgi:hypothetical protein
VYLYSTIMSGVQLGMAEAIIKERYANSIENEDDTKTCHLRLQPIHLSSRVAKNLLL